MCVHVCVCGWRVRGQRGRLGLGPRAGTAAQEPCSGRPPRLPGSPPIRCRPRPRPLTCCPRPAPAGAPPAGATYRSMEFVGDAVSQMNMEERMTVCNMVVEAGGKNGVCPADQTTFDYVESRTSEPYEAVYSDDTASYFAGACGGGGWAGWLGWRVGLWREGCRLVALEPGWAGRWGARNRRRSSS